MSEPLDDLDASVTAALADAEERIAQVSDFATRMRDDGAEIEINHLPLDVMAEEITFDDDELRWPNGEPVRIFTYWPSEQE